MNKKEAQDLYWDVIDIINDNFTNVSKEDIGKLKIFLKLSRAILFKKKKVVNNRFNPNRWLANCIDIEGKRKNLQYIIVSEGLVFSTDGSIIAIDNRGSNLEDGYYNKDLIKQDIDLPYLNRSAVENINPTSYECKVTLHIEWDKVKLESVGKNLKYALHITRSVDNNPSQIYQDGIKVGIVTHLNSDTIRDMKDYEGYFDSMKLSRVTDMREAVFAEISMTSIHPMKIKHDSVYYGFIVPLAKIKK